MHAAPVGSHGTGKACKNHHMAAPQLTGDALKAVTHRGSHIQIIAAAGSGKTEVVSQRIVDLLADGVSPEGIVAFTFTERAAGELRHRVRERAEERLGPAALDRLAPLSIGTIHGYCFRLLQTYVPRYETYDVLDDHKLTAFLAREATRLNLRVLSDRNRTFDAITRFISSVDVVENELLDRSLLEEPFASVLDDYYDTLERYRLLTYGQQIVRAVEELKKPSVQAAVQAPLRHLIVDEYQDVNPAQERLIELLAGPRVEICVVGDDDQAIYQWRGSDVRNIVKFEKRYKGVATFRIDTNRRSRPTIIATANQFAESIPGRLPKSMQPFRSAADSAEVVSWSANKELDEAGYIASLIDDLHESGVPYRDMAVLVRSKAAYARLLEQFGALDIPVQPGGRTGLFEQPIALLLGQMFCWLADEEWRPTHQTGVTIEESDLLDAFKQIFQLSTAQRNRVRRVLQEWKAIVDDSVREANLVGELYELFEELAIGQWNLDDPIKVNDLGTLARFSALLADYESVRRRSRPDPDKPGEQVGGEGRSKWFYINLARHIVNYAQGKYEGFDGEENLSIDAVDLLTVHRSKGLEWPVVFVPSMTKSRFPSSKTGSAGDWLVPRDTFNAARYEGSDADERRLFYVAITRARDWLSVSRHERININRTAPSPYFGELSAHQVDPDQILLPSIETKSVGDTPVEVTFSELATFLECGMEYRLRNLIGFQPKLAVELGYGKAVHHVLRTVAEYTQENGKVPTDSDITALIEQSFFLPTANKPAHKKLKEAARRLVSKYAQDHADELHRVWETERPFELHLDGITISGRADVILDHEGGRPDHLAILDYKTSVKGSGLHDLQLQVYANAGRREGLDVRAAYIHDLKAGTPESVDVSDAAVKASETRVLDAAGRLRRREYRPTTSKAKCRACEVRSVCGSARR